MTSQLVFVALSYVQHNSQHCETTPTRLVVPLEF